MSHKHNRKKKKKHRAENNKPPSTQSTCEASVIHTVRIDPDPEQEKRYTEEKQYRQDQLDKAHMLNIISGIGVGVAFLGLVGLAIYVCQTIEANRLTRTQFIQQRAPYIWINASNPILKDNERIIWDIRFSNYGTSPALKVRNCGFYGLGGGGHDARGFLRPLTYSECQGLSGSVEGNIAGSVLPQGVERLFTIRTQQVFHESDRHYFDTIDGYLVTEGVFDYEDTTGHKYETVYCVERLATGAVNDCKNYNYIKPAE